MMIEVKLSVNICWLILNKKILPMRKNYEHNIWKKDKNRKGWKSKNRLQGNKINLIHPLSFLK